MKSTTKGTAATQGVAAPKTTATKVAQTGSAGNAGTVTKTFSLPKVKVAKEKVAKESKRVTGVLVHIAKVSYNYWRGGVNQIINGEDKTIAKVARFVKDSSAFDTKWGGFIGVSPENVEKVLGVMNAWTAENSAKPLTGTDDVQLVQPWILLDTFATVAPKARAKKEVATA